MFAFQESVSITFATAGDHIVAVFSLRLEFISSCGDRMKTIFHSHLTNASDFQYEAALGHLNWKKCIVFNLAYRN